MSRIVTTPPAATPRADGLYPGGWWHEEPETGRIHCDLCPRDCSLKPGDRGFCFVRQNVDGEMVLTTFGRSTGFCIDPIEKKPLNHFYAGSSVLSFGTAGRNLGCKFCQNRDISKSKEVERLSEAAMPDEIAEADGRVPFEAYEMALRRELDEEVEIASDGALRLVGLINDDATPSVRSTWASSIFTTSKPPTSAPARTTSPRPASSPSPASVTTGTPSNRGRRSASTASCARSICRTGQRSATHHGRPGWRLLARPRIAYFAQSINAKASVVGSGVEIGGDVGVSR